MGDEIETLELTPSETPSSDDLVALALEIDSGCQHCFDANNKLVIDFRTVNLAKRFIATFGERYSFGGDIDMHQHHTTRSRVFVACFPAMRNWDGEGSY